LGLQIYDAIKIVAACACCMRVMAIIYSKIAHRLGFFLHFNDSTSSGAETALMRSSICQKTFKNQNQISIKKIEIFTIQG
jgi:hypothetical protein